MRKTLLVGSFLTILAIGLNSCHKCYTCSLTTTEIVNDKDSSIILTTEVCNGKNGAGANLNVALQDIEANGYICNPK
jgi:hypothetical protein